MASSGKWKPMEDFEDVVDAQNPTGINFEQYYNEDNYGLNIYSKKNEIDTSPSINAMASLKMKSMVERYKKSNKSNKCMSAEEEITSIIRETGIEEECPEYRMREGTSTALLDDRLPVNGLKDVYLDDDFFKLIPAVATPTIKLCTVADASISPSKSEKTRVMPTVTNDSNSIRSVPKNLEEKFFTPKELYFFKGKLHSENNN